MQLILIFNVTDNDNQNQYQKGNRELKMKFTISITVLKLRHGKLRIHLTKCQSKIVPIDKMSCPQKWTFKNHAENKIGQKKSSLM